MRLILRERKSKDGHQFIPPLRDVVERLGGVAVRFWYLREVTFTCKDDFFGIAVPAVEEMTRRLSGGLGLTDQDFRALVQTDFQMMDGFIDAFDGTPSNPLFRLECIDSAQWEVDTLDGAISILLKERGFVEAADGGEGGGIEPAVTTGQWNIEWD